MKNALLVLDVQKIYTLVDSPYYVSDAGEIIGKINDIIATFEKRADLVIFIKHEHDTDGSDSGRMFDYAGEMTEVEFQKGSVEAEFDEKLLLLPNAKIVVKHRYNAFVGTSLQAILKENHIDKVTICGFMTNFCCESTARYAHDVDYFVDFIIDATGTPGTEELNPKETLIATAATLSAGFAVVKNTIDIVGN